MHWRPLLHPPFSTTLNKNEKKKMKTWRTGSTLASKTALNLILDLLLPFAFLLHNEHKWYENTCA